MVLLELVKRVTKENNRKQLEIIQIRMKKYSKNDCKRAGFFCSSHCDVHLFYFVVIAVIEHVRSLGGRDGVVDVSHVHGQTETRKTRVTKS